MVVVASVVVVSILSLCKALFVLFGLGTLILLSFTVGGFMNYEYHVLSNQKSGTVVNPYLRCIIHPE